MGRSRKHPKLWPFVVDGSTLASRTVWPTKYQEGEEEEEEEGMEEDEEEEAVKRGPALKNI